MGSEGWEEGESEEEHEEELEEADEDGEDKEKNDEKEIKEEEREEQITSKKDEGIKEEDEKGKEEACPSSTRTTDESKSHDVFNTILSHFFSLFHSMHCGYLKPSSVQSESFSL